MFTQDNPNFDSATLDAQLANLKPIQLQATANSSIPGIPSELTLDESAPVEPETEATTESESTEETTEAPDTQEETLETTPAFAEEFKKTFGIEPAEAIEVVNGLKAFQEEMQLMRAWAVTPAEYDQRISSVREFYQALPDDGKAQFNSAQGAIAIWNHLQSNAPATTKKASVKPTTGKLKSAPVAETIKKSDVLRMSNDDYRANLSKIQKAVLEGRFVEDV
jgi:hypothetical protein